MKKKLAISLLTGAILLGGAGTFAYAQTGGFEEMKPYMEKAHPELSNQELEQMYNVNWHIISDGDFQNNSAQNLE